MDDLMTYEDVLAHLKKSKREKHLLLGNGFSMAYDPKIFSYNALSNYIKDTDNKILVKLFSIINTTNFELVMKQLDVFYMLSKDFLSDPSLANDILQASNDLKQSLMDAVTKLHPEQVFNIPSNQSNKCALFLKDYLDFDGHVFTTNYDLLLYWVLMRNKEKIENVNDGFGKEYIEKTDYEPNFEPEFGDLEWGPNKRDQHVHYLHGALHIFDSGISIEKEIYSNVGSLLENIKCRIEKKQYPVFVTAGNGNDKLEHIMHNQYLDYCYENLINITGSLITCGFGFGEYDFHIIDAINKAASKPKEGRLWSVYIGVYSDKDIVHIKSIQDKFKCKVKMFDVRTINAW